MSKPNFCSSRQDEGHNVRDGTQGAVAWANSRFALEPERGASLAVTDESSTITEASQLWYGIRTKSKCERAAADSLAFKGYISFFPCYRSRRRWSDRVTEIEAPLFPGYVFCRFDISKRLPILTTPGVVSVVGIGKQPEAIPDKEIAAVATILKSELFAEPWPYLREGQGVRIERGPLKGVEGIVVKKTKDDWRIVVSVTILQRSVAAEIDRDWIRPTT